MSLGGGFIDEFSGAAASRGAQKLRVSQANMGTIVGGGTSAGVAALEAARLGQQIGGDVMASLALPTGNASLDATALAFMKPGANVRDPPRERTHRKDTIAQYSGHYVCHDRSWGANRAPYPMPQQHEAIFVKASATFPPRLARQLTVAGHPRAGANRGGWRGRVCA